MDGAAFRVRDGRLHVEELACTEFAARFGTPLYVVSETRLRANVRRLGAALAAGWPPALISVNGASKSAALIGHAVAAWARITLDSGRELPIAEKAAADAATTARVRIRLRPRLDRVEAPSDFAGDGTSIREEFQSYKAGVPIDDAVALGRAALESRHVELVGVHAHLARQTADISLWRAQIASFAALLAELSFSWGRWLSAEIDFGGGWEFPMDPVGRRPADAPAAGGCGRLCRAVAESLAEALRYRGLTRPGMLLEAEPGRAIYADAGLHLATVTNVNKQRDPDPRCWVETDTSEVFMLDTTLEGALFPVVSATRADAEPTLLADVTGISCNFDVMRPRLRSRMAPGEVIAFPPDRRLPGSVGGELQRPAPSGDRACVWRDGRGGEAPGDHRGRSWA